MRKSFRQDRQSLFRAVLLIGVTAGLLFSCGEGIRLFPFPPSEAAPNVGWESAGEIGYQKNVHRFESNQEKCKSKSHPDKTKFHRTNNSKRSNDSPSFVLATRRETDSSIN